MKLPLRTRSPAKINLNLRILGKRPDGFFEIDTLMAKLPGLADSLTITPAASFSFTCSHPDLPTNDSNLVVRAALAFARASSSPLPYHIHLEKHIPHGAGLGGGSSNAATILLALNGLQKNPLPPDGLHEIAASLGSDIPFFLIPGPARCTGRGEIIQPSPPLPPLPPLAIVLFKPAFSVPTPEAYRNYSSSRAISGITYGPQNIGNLELVNDLELPVFEKHRYLAELKTWLLGQSCTRAALMSGSGSTLFAILDAPESAPTLLTNTLSAFDRNLWHWSGIL